MADVKSKIVKLLRLAEDRKGTPEGETAQRIADELISVHGVNVGIDDVEFEQPIVQHLVAHCPERTWWKEMLLVTLCDLYGGEAVTLVYGDGYRLHVVSDDALDSDLRPHFEYLSALIEDLCDASAAEFMRATPFERNDAVASFCIGSVHYISQGLYSFERGEWPDLEQMPFMRRALTGTVDHSQDRHEANFASSVTSSLAITSQFEVRHHHEEDEVEVVPDWRWFEAGYRCAERDIIEVFPPEGTSVEDLASGD